MKIYLLKNKQCFTEKGKEWYGWAGDEFIASLVVAKNKESAMKLVFEEVCGEYGWDFEDGLESKQEDWGKFIEDWTVEEYKPDVSKEKIDLLTYGSY